MRTILIVLLILILGSWYLRRNESRPETNRPQQRTPLPPAEKMVRCAECGIYLPASEARSIAQTGTTGTPLYFCCDAHRNAFQKRHV